MKPMGMEAPSTQHLCAWRRPASHSVRKQAEAHRRKAPAHHKALLQSPACTAVPCLGGMEHLGNKQECLVTALGMLQAPKESYCKERSCLWTADRKQGSAHCLSTGKCYGSALSPDIGRSYRLLYRHWERSWDGGMFSPSRPEASTQYCSRGKETRDLLDWKLK